MNILKLELKFDLKRFIFWSVGLFILIIAGLTKFIGISSGAGGEGDITQLLDEFPKIILAMMGMANVNIDTLGGYYYILQYYALICVIIYSVHLGTSAVLREDFDKTYEFVFTKPRKRSFILTMKLLASFIYLFVFSLFNGLFSLISIKMLNIDADINRMIFLCMIVSFLVGLLVMCLSACIATLVKKPEQGTKISYLCFFAFFILGIIYDIVEKGGFIKLFTPIKYFEGNDLLNGKIDIVFIMICIVCSALLLLGAYKAFNKKDLNAT